jgi:ATPase family associated with various cellular activities (AAA)
MSKALIAQDDWLEANGRFMAAAVAWVRALLRRGVADQAARRPDWRSRVGVGRSSDDSVSAKAAMVAAAQTMVPPPALFIVADRLGLSSFERGFLLLCAAVELDTSVAGLCAQAQGDPARPYPTFALALSLFDNAAWDVLSPERPLRRWRLVEIAQAGGTPLTVSPLRADERIVNYLKSVTYLDDRLGALLEPLAAAEGQLPPSQQGAAQRAVRVWRAVDPSQPPPPIQLLGSDAASKRAVAARIGEMLGLRLLRLDPALLPTAPADLDAFARLWQREARLLPVALYLDADGADAAQAVNVDRLIGRIEGPVLLAVRQLWPNTHGASVTVDVEKPTPAEQADVWREALGANAGDLPDAMAAQFNLNASAIVELTRREQAQASDSEAGAAGLNERLWDAAREVSRPRLDTLARRVIPRATWDDIVLPQAETALLHAIADQVGQRAKVYRQWGFADRMNRGLGITVLFAGPSGTGKTMAAEVLASHLRLDLFRIDLSTVVSKYIGETEANLRRVFDAAEDGGAILFFDEADALFGKRTEVKDSHDRYANIEIDYLLQRMEAFGGLAILATNMKSALDAAFLRRLRFVLDFPFPGLPERGAIWRRVFPAATPTQGLDFDRLARLNVTGGHIAVIALNAAFQAARAGGPVTMPMVLNAARIEYRKLGRPVNEADFRSREAAA